MTSRCVWPSQNSKTVILKESVRNRCGRTTEVTLEADSPLAKIHCFRLEDGCFAENDNEDFLDSLSELSHKNERNDQWHIKRRITAT
jgi:hypothetical protein